MAGQVVRIKVKPYVPATRREWPALIALRLPRVLTQIVSALALALPQGRLRRVLLVRVVRAAMDAISQQDMGLMRALGAPGFEGRFAPQIVAMVGHDGPVVHGPEGVVAFMDSWYESWGEFGVVVREVIDLGGGRMLLLNHLRATGASSGVAVDEQREAQLWEFRNGLAVRYQQWLNWNEPLEAVGLSE